MARPETTLVRRGELVAWLAEYGIPAREVAAVIRDRVISTRTLHEGGRGFYLVAEVEERVLGPLLLSRPAPQTRRSLGDKGIPNLEIGNEGAKARKKRKLAKL